jgi:hypothetical protein
VISVPVQYSLVGTRKKIPGRMCRVIAGAVQNENQYANLCSSEILIPGI